MSVARWGRWVPLAALLIAAGCKREHPTASTGGKEHPAEHPAGAEAAKITKDSLADAIEAWVGKQGGTLKVRDDKIGKTLSFSLVKVHRERIAHLSKNKYFVCADFKTPAGKVYDLDVFVEGTALGNLKFGDLTIHKEAGKARYTWYEEGGAWKKKPMAVAGSAPKRAKPKGSATKPVKTKGEHPTAEHPR